MSDQGNGSPGRAGRRAAAWGAAVAAAILALLAATEPRLAVVWDEGFTLGREQRVRDWFRALDDPAAFAATWKPVSAWDDLVQPEARPLPKAADFDTRAELFQQRQLEWFWPFAREEPHGHPPFYALVGLVGDWLAPRWELLSRARLGPMLLFSLVGGALFAFLAARRGWWAAAAGAGAWVLQPRLFAHAHYAHYDDVLTSLWVAALMAFAMAVDPRPGEPPRRWPRALWTALFGVIVGCAMGTKLTGWFLPLPFVAWTVLYRDRRGFVALIAAGLIAPLVLWGMTPPWWFNPVNGVERFLESNLTRSRTTKIPTLFLGRIILTPLNSLPWYNTLVWTLFVTPAGFLLLAVFGAFDAVRRAKTDRVAALAALNWAFLLALRAMPHTPGHDAERQFLAAFGCLAVVAGYGAGWAAERLGRWGRAWAVAAIAEGAVSIAVMMPVPLSYYSPLVGGLPGATALGMEPTYYWDALHPGALAWLNANTPPDGKVVFPTNPTIWRYLHNSGKLRPGTVVPDPGEWTWYVFQNRPGGFRPVDPILVARARPENVLVSKLGVPLVYIFPIADLERAMAEVDPGR